MVSITYAGVFAVGLWMCLNIGLNCFNKFLFNFMNFRFPLLLLLVGNLVSFFGCLIFVQALPFLSHRGCCRWSLFSRSLTFDLRNLETSWFKILLISAFHGGSVLLETISILYISLSLNQIIKATMPVFTMLLSFLLEGKRYGPLSFFSTLVVIIGALLTVYHNPSFHMLGFLCAIGSTLMGAVGNIVASLLLSVSNHGDKHEELSSLEITMATTLPISLFLLPLFLELESEEFLPFLEHENAFVSIMILVCSGLLAFLYNISHFLVIHTTDGHFSAVVGNIKVVLLVGLSVPLFRTPIRTINVVGMLICLFGFCLYTYAKEREEFKRREKDKPEELQEFIISSKFDFGTSLSERTTSHL